MYNKPLVYRRKLTKDRRGHYRLSIPSELAKFLGLSKGGNLAIVPDTDHGGLILHAWSEDLITMEA